MKHEVGRLLSVHGLLLGHTHRLQARVSLALVVEGYALVLSYQLQRGRIDLRICVLCVRFVVRHVVCKRLSKRSVTDYQATACTWLLGMLPFDVYVPAVKHVATAT